MEPTRRRRATALAAACCAVGAAIAVPRLTSVPAGGKPPSKVCSTIGSGPSACVAVHGQSVAVTLRNELNVEVCGDFRLSLLRTEGTHDRLPESNEPELHGCLPASHDWAMTFPLRPPGQVTAGGIRRPYRFMCVTGYRLLYARWTETAWACTRSRPGGRSS